MTNAAIADQMESEAKSLESDTLTSVAEDFANEHTAKYLRKYAALLRQSAAAPEPGEPHDPDPTRHGVRQSAKAAASQAQYWFARDDIDLINRWREVGWLIECLVRSEVEAAGIAGQQAGGPGGVLASAAAQRAGLEESYRNAAARLERHISITNETLAKTPREIAEIIERELQAAVKYDPNQMEWYLRSVQAAVMSAISLGVQAVLHTVQSSVSVTDEMVRTAIKARHPGSPGLWDDEDEMSDMRVALIAGLSALRTAQSPASVTDEAKFALRTTIRDTLTKYKYDDVELTDCTTDIMNAALSLPREPAQGQREELAVDLEYRAKEARADDERGFLLTNEKADKLVAALRTSAVSASPGAGVEGWKLVPVEPTLEMCSAGKNSINPKLENAEGVPYARRVYRNMLAVAPSPASKGE